LSEAQEFEVQFRRFAANLRVCLPGVIDGFDAERQRARVVPGLRMKTIHSLVSRNLGYIHGERESRPNGDKKQFLSTSAAFLRALGNDLGLKEFKVTVSPGGIALSGDVTLMGMWGEGNGLYLQMNQPLQPSNSFMFRTIRNMKDYSGGHNQWLPCDLFRDGDYEKLINIMSALNTSIVSALNTSKEEERLAA
jgi:hypothetical protein